MRNYFVSAGLFGLISAVDINAEQTGYRYVPTGDPILDAFNLKLFCELSQFAAFANVQARHLCDLPSGSSSSSSTNRIPVQPQPSTKSDQGTQ